MSRYLSKSKYTSFRQCPKILWMRTYKPDEEVIGPALQARFESGNEVGDLAMGLFGEFEEVTSYDAAGKLDLSEMLSRTKDCLSRGVENICEASFSWDGNYCAVDVLHRQGDGYAVYEVKSSTNSSSEPAEPEELRHYAWDIAYQKYVLTQCGVKVTGVYLVQLNSDYFRGKELDIQELFLKTDMSELVDEEYPDISANIVRARKLLEDDQEPSNMISLACRKPYPCSFWRYCSKHIPDPSVFNLYRMPFSKALEYYNAGIITFEDVLSCNLSDKQQLQIAGHLTGNGYIDKRGIKDFLDKNIRYPLYFLDFETMQDVVPQYEGTKPYQQVPFQYSLHWIEKPGGELKHTAFLAESGKDPRRALAEQLCMDIPLNACTTAYNKGFECGRINELAETFPDLSYHLLNIRDNIVDFLDPFRAGYYYLPAMCGSFSIKKVLPALFPDDPQLDYSNLTGPVHNGGDAMSIFPKIKDMAPEEQLEARQALLEYCHLDTLAMVKIWQRLEEISRDITHVTPSRSCK